MMLKMVQDVVHKIVQEHYAHTLIPAVMHAQVTGRTELGPKYEYEDMTVDKCDICGALTDKKIIGKWYEYKLKVLTRDGAPDERFPEVPGVKSKIQIKPGGKAAVVMLYGELRPFIVGEAR